MSRRFFSNLTNRIPAHSLVSTRSGVLKLMQIRPIDPKRSDHTRNLVQLNNKNDCLIVENGLKAAKPTNNGFGYSENEQDYLKRREALILSRCDDIEKYTKQGFNIVGIKEEESSIKPTHIQKERELFNTEMKKRKIAGWENSTSKVSGFGVMTCLRSDIAQSFHYDELFEQKLGKLADHCHLYNSSDSYGLFHKHNTKNTSITDFHTLLSVGIKHKISTLTAGEIRCCDWMGDTNLEPAVQKKISDEVCRLISAERVAAGKKPLAVVSFLASSPNGHQELHNGEAIFTNVDSARRFLICESDKYHFEHENETIENMSPKKRGYLLHVLLGGGTLFAGNTLAIDDAAALMEIAYAVAQRTILPSVNEATTAVMCI